MAPGSAGPRSSPAACRRGSRGRLKSAKSGSYTIPNLKAGVYEVTVEVDRTDRAMLEIRVTVGTSSRLDFTLYPSSPQE